MHKGRQEPVLRALRPYGCRWHATSSAIICKICSKQSNCGGNVGVAHTYLHVRRQSTKLASSQNIKFIELLPNKQRTAFPCLVYLVYLAYWLAGLLVACLLACCLLFAITRDDISAAATTSGRLSCKAHMLSALFVVVRILLMLMRLCKQVWVCVLR